LPFFGLVVKQLISFELSFELHTIVWSF